MTTDATIDSEFWNALPLDSAGYRMGLRPTERWLTQATETDRAFKASLLTSQPEAVIAETKGSEALVRLVCEAIEHSLPIELDETSLRSASLGIRDDLCIVDRSSTPTLAAACVCAPSYWRLADKIGRPIRAVHAGVPGMNEMLGDRIDTFFRRLPEHRVFERRNWFIHTSSERFQPSDDIEETFNSGPLFLRSERQTLKALGDGVLFGIDVTIKPLEEVRRVPDQLAALCASLSALTGNELEHFGGADKRNAIARRLADWFEAG